MQELGGGEVVVGVDDSLNKLGKVGGGNNALVGSLVAGVELGVGIAAAEGEGVHAVNPDGVRRRHDAILKDSGKSSLRGRALTDDQRLLVGYGARIGCVTGGADASICRARDSERIHDADAGEERRAECIDRRCPGLTGERLRRERLSDSAVNLLPKNAEHFGNA